MDAINTSHGPSQADLLVQQSVQQAAAPQPTATTEETGETAPESVEAPEGNLGQNVNTYA